MELGFLQDLDSRFFQLLSGSKCRMFGTGKGNPSLLVTKHLNFVFLIFTLWPHHIACGILVP